MSLLSTKINNNIQNSGFSNVYKTKYSKRSFIKILNDWDKYRNKMEKYIVENEFVRPEDTCTRKITFCKIIKDNISCVFQNNELELLDNDQPCKVVYEIYTEYINKGIPHSQECGLRFEIVLHPIHTDETPYVLHVEEYEFNCAKLMYKTMKKMIECE
jgi:hypothetical protein